MSTKRTTRIQIRVTQDELLEIDRRIAGADRSKWLRALALGAAVERSRTQARPRGWTTGFSALDWAKANALASVAAQLSALLKRCDRDPGRLSPGLERELREVAGHVRARLLS